MPPRIAAWLFAVGILGLFRLDREPGARTSPALWLASAWIFFGASRNPMQWLGGGVEVETPGQYLEGSPVDRLILSVLLASGLAVLASRRQVRAFLGANLPVVLFFAYCALSALWSDFPFVAFKRWTKALGNLTMVLVVLTDPSPAAAMRRLFSRIGFLLIPLSVLFIKYYPELGRGYSRWTWEPFFTGAATEKNALGCICMIFGLASFWRFVGAFHRTDASPRGGHLLAHGVILAMTGWLFWMADSSTAFACFSVGALLILVMMTWGANRPAAAHVFLGSMVLAGILMFVFRDAYAVVVQALGRDVTLTGRTDIWAELLAIKINPWLGTGFETFWLGERAEYFWNKYYFHPNQAHNGYIETYVNLGWVGVGLLTLMITSGYRNIVDTLRQDPQAGALKLAFFAVALIYSMTEAAFKVMHPVWIAFLLAVTVIPTGSAPRQVPVAVESPWKPRPKPDQPRGRHPVARAASVFRVASRVNPE
jgi:O-antigen ligase